MFLEDILITFLSLLRLHSLVLNYLQFFHSYFILLMSQSVLHFFSAFCNKNVCSHLKILVFTCLSLARMTQGVNDNFLENIAFVLLINTLLQTKMALVDYRDRVSYLS